MKLKRQVYFIIKYIYFKKYECVRVWVTNDLTRSNKNVWVDFILIGFDSNLPKPTRVDLVRVTNFKFWTCDSSHPIYWCGTIFFPYFYIILAQQFHRAWVNKSMTQPDPKLQISQQSKKLLFQSWTTQTNSFFIGLIWFGFEKKLQNPRLNSTMNTPIKEGVE